MTPEEVEGKLTEHEMHLIAHDTKLLAMQNMLQTGLHMLVSMEVKLNALIDSHTKLYGTVQELAEMQKRTDAALQRTDAALRNFIEHSGGRNGHPSA
jgi:type VI protein secretion system component VasF